MAKVFIGCVTYAKDEHALPLLLASLRKFTFTDWELHFIDTTPQTAPALAPYKPRLAQEIKSRLPAARTADVTAYVPRREGEAIFEVIANARNQLRERFLASGCTHLLFIDDDMTFPPETIDLLLSHDAPAVAGVYINHLGYKKEEGLLKKLGPVGWVHSPKGSEYCRPLRLIDVIPPRVIRILLTGFGCVLLRREVLEQVPIVYDAEHQVTEDTPFYSELDRRGIPVLMDTRVKCAHHKFPAGDLRNRFLDFANYAVQVRQKPGAGPTAGPGAA